jgi:hypothetical protein
VVPTVIAENPGINGTGIKELTKALGLGKNAVDAFLKTLPFQPGKGREHLSYPPEANEAAGMGRRQVFKQRDWYAVPVSKSGQPGFTGSRSGAARGAYKTTRCLKTCPPCWVKSRTACPLENGITGIQTQPHQEGREFTLSPPARIVAAFGLFDGTEYDTGSIDVSQHDR